MIVSTGGAGSPGSDAGNITVSAPILWSSGHSLTLSANNSIFIDAAITGGGALVTLSAGSDIIQPAEFSGTGTGIQALALSATSANGRVVLTSDNLIASSVSGSAPLGFSFANDGPLTVGDITAISGPIALAAITLPGTTGDAIAQTGPIKGQSLYAATVSGDINLTNLGNSVAAIAGYAGVPDSFLNAIANALGLHLPPGPVSGPGTFEYYNSSANLSIGSVNGYVSIPNSNTPVLATASGGIGASSLNGNGASIAVFNHGDLIVDSAVQSVSPTGIVQLAATDYFINNFGPSAITTTSGGNWQVYSVAPAGDLFNGLDSGNPAVWNTIFGERVTARGDRYVFAVGPPFDPGFLPALTQINNPSPTEYDVGGYEQVLPHFTVACNEPPSLPDPNRFSDPDTALRAISQSMENYFRQCQNSTQTTIADAMDEYAAKLQILAPRLPPALRRVPAIVAEGARRVRAARSRTEAVAVLRQTVAAVHKEIALVLSEDPETRSREVRDGDVIAGALGGANVALVNSGGL